MNYTMHERSKRYFVEKNIEDMLDSPAKSSRHHKLYKDMERAKGESDIQERQSADTAVQVSLKQEVDQLTKRLKEQFVLRHALEEALGSRSFATETSNDLTVPKPTKELIGEIAVLEFEVMHLEKYLLSLYQKTFDQQTLISAPIIVGNTVEQSFMNHSAFIKEAARLNASSKKGYPKFQSSRILSPRMLVTDPVNERHTTDLEEKLAYRAVHRSHSSLPQRSFCSSRIQPSAENSARGLRPCQSLPFTSVESAISEVSLADYLGASITNHVPETPSKLSEDIVRCMGAIYCKLAEPPLLYHGLASSPASSFSSMSASSPRYMGDMWSPGYKRESILDARLYNPFRVEGLKEFSGPYNTMVEVPLLCRDKMSIKVVEDMMQKYKLLVQRLESVDPRSMKNEEKLAFWINIHNALIMHAYLEYGVPQNHAKRAYAISKATYTVGGRTINVDTIQGTILGCRTYRPGLWLRLILSQRLKFKDGHEWKHYCIDHPEPLLHFALCSGSHSDPAVRIYTSKRVINQLEAAKEEFIRASIGIQKEQKILLPKVIDYFSKETSLNLQGVLDMIKHYLPESLQIVMQRCQQGKSNKIVEWVSYNFTFRYLLSRELAVHLTD